MPDQIGDIREDIGSLKALVATLTDSVRTLTENSSAGRARIYEKLEGMDRKMDRAEGEIKGLSARVDAIEPFANEYKTRMAHVEGARWLGRALWATGGFVLAFAAWLVSGWDWMMRMLRQ